MAKLSERDKEMQAVVARLSKKFGSDVIRPVGKNAPPVQAVPAASTGSIGLDVALGVGGLPFGRIVELYGPEGGGKTTVAMQVCAAVQAAGAAALFIDAEHTLDLQYARQLGVNPDQLVVAQPDYGEQGLEILESILDDPSGVEVAVIDSVAALTPKAEIDGDLEDQHVGVQARMMSQALRRLNVKISRSGILTIWVNQIRMKIGVRFGSPETTPGGKALKFFASVRLDVRQIGTLRTGTDPYGSRTRVKVVKNKCAPPFKEAEFDLVWGHGISRAAEAVDLGVTYGTLEKSSGHIYTFQGTRIGLGRDNTVASLEANPELSERIWFATRDAALAAQSAPVSDEPPGDDNTTSSAETTIEVTPEDGGDSGE